MKRLPFELMKEVPATKREQDTPPVLMDAVKLKLSPNINELVKHEAETLQKQVINLLDGAKLSGKSLMIRTEEGRGINQSNMIIEVKKSDMDDQFVDFLQKLIKLKTGSDFITEQKQSIEILRNAVVESKKEVMIEIPGIYSTEVFLKVLSDEEFNVVDHTEAFNKLRDYYKTIAVWDRLSMPDNEGTDYPITQATYVRLVVLNERIQQSRMESQIKSDGYTVQRIDDLELLEHMYNPSAKQIMRPLQLFEHPQVVSASIKKIVVVGNAGSGKSTLAKYLLSLWVNSEFLERKFKWIFYISLPELIEIDNPNTLIREDDFLAKILHIKLFNQQGIIFRQVIDILKFNNNPSDLLLILEGLDEIPETHLNLAHKLFETQQATVLLTSRPHAIGKLKPGLTSLKVESVGFDDKQIKEFIKHHYFVSDKSTGNLLYEELLKAKKEQLRLWSICHLPKNLVYICYLWKQTSIYPGLKFTLSEIYKKLTDNLIGENLDRIISEDTILSGIGSLEKSNLMTETGKAINRMLDQLAFEGMQNKLAKKVDYDKLANNLYKTLNDQAIKRLFELAYANNSFITKITLNNNIFYNFIHPSFQEFFAADYFVNELKEKVNCLEVGSSLHTFIKVNITNPKYKEIFCFMAGLLSQEENMDCLKKFFEVICSFEPIDEFLWVYHCLLFVNEFSGDEDKLITIYDLHIIKGILKKCSTIFEKIFLDLFISGYGRDQIEFLLKQIILNEFIVNNIDFWTVISDFFIRILCGSTRGSAEYMQAVELIEFVNNFIDRYPDKMWDVIRNSGFLECKNKLYISNVLHIFNTYLDKYPKQIFKVIENNLEANDLIYEHSEASDFFEKLLGKYFWDTVDILSQHINSGSSVGENILRLIGGGIIFKFPRQSFNEEEIKKLLTIIDKNLYSGYVYQLADDYLQRSAKTIISQLISLEYDYLIIFNYYLEKLNDAESVVFNVYLSILILIEAQVRYKEQEEQKEQISLYLINKLSNRTASNREYICYLLESILDKNHVEIVSKLLLQVTQSDYPVRYGIYSILLCAINKFDEETLDLVSKTEISLPRFKQNPCELIETLEKRGMKEIIEDIKKELNSSNPANRRILWLFVNNVIVSSNYNEDLLNRLFFTLDLNNPIVVNHAIILLISIADHNPKFCLKMLERLANSMPLHNPLIAPSLEELVKLYCQFIKKLIENIDSKIIVKEISRILKSNSKISLELYYEFLIKDNVIKDTDESIFSSTSIIISRLDPADPEGRSWTLLRKVAEINPIAVYNYVFPLITSSSTNLNLTLTLMKIVEALSIKLPEEIFKLIMPVLKVLSEEKKVPFTHITLKQIYQYVPTLDRDMQEMQKNDCLKIICYFFNILTRLIVVDQYREEILILFPPLIDSDDFHVRSGIIQVLDKLAENSHEEVLFYIKELLLLRDDKLLRKRVYEILKKISINHCSEVITLFKDFIPNVNSDSNSEYFFSYILNFLFNLSLNDIPTALPLIEFILNNYKVQDSLLGLNLDHLNEENKNFIRDHFVENLIFNNSVNKAALLFLRNFDCAILISEDTLQKITYEEAQQLYSGTPLKSLSSTLLKLSNPELIVRVMIDKANSDGFKIYPIGPEVIFYKKEGERIKIELLTDKFTLFKFVFEKWKEEKLHPQIKQKSQRSQSSINSASSEGLQRHGIFSSDHEGTDSDISSEEKSGDEIDSSPKKKDSHVSLRQCCVVE